MSKGDADFIRDKVRATWQFRAEEATQGNGSKLGAILLGVLHRTPHQPPAYGSKAAITTDDKVFCDYLDQSGVYHRAAYVCEVGELVSNFRGLADHLKLTDAERKEMFAELRKWIVKDYRAVSDVNLWDNRVQRHLEGE
jgi:hypothetical protein